MITKEVKYPSLFYFLADILDQSHPLYRLADKIDWKRFVDEFTPLYSHSSGRRTAIVAKGLVTEQTVIEYDTLRYDTTRYDSTLFFKSV